MHGLKRRGLETSLSNRASPDPTWVALVKLRDRHAEKNEITGHTAKDDILPSADMRSEVELTP